MMNHSTAGLREHATILIVDDEEVTVRTLKRMLQRAGYDDVHATLDALEALTLHRTLRPDLVILDLHMPDCNGFVVLEQLRADIPERSYLPVLMMTGDSSREVMHQAFIHGVTDFLTKPLDFLEVRYRVSNLLQTRFLYLEAQHQSRLLDEVVQARGLEIEDARFEVLQYMLSARRPHVAAARQNLIGHVSALLAREMELTEEAIERIRWVAHLYEAAAAGTSRPVGRWLARLAAHETERMIHRAREEAQLIFEAPSPRLLELTEEVVLTRHEHWDGTGFPQKLAGEQIPLATRVIAAAEHFSDLVRDPLFRNSWPTEASIAELIAQSGRRFDPRVVQALVELNARCGVGALWQGALTPAAEAR
jgi:putative two-component system response regulator